MQEEMTISIVLHGKLHSCFHENLYRFNSYAKDLLREVGVPSTHIGIHGQLFKSGKINVIKKIEAKLMEAIEKKEEILALSIYSLPENYSHAAFDTELDLRYF